MSARLAVLLSGRGSNLLALQRAIDDGALPARIVLVISNEPAAPGLERAKELGLAAVAIPHRGTGGRAVHEGAVLSALARAEVEWVCLAGYMRVLSASFLDHYPARVLNIHPSLLPSFPGLDAQEQALSHGVRLSGCTVHFVDAGLDSGPIVEQRAVPVRDDDTVHSLSERILEQEHATYPSALARLLREPWVLAGRRVIFGRSPGG